MFHLQLLFTTREVAILCAASSQPDRQLARVLLHFCHDGICSGDDIDRFVLLLCITSSGHFSNKVTLKNETK